MCIRDSLTTAVRDGIVGHTGATIPVTLEGQIIRIVDRIAYLCHDFDDAQRAGMLTAEAVSYTHLCHITFEVIFIVFRTPITESNRTVLNYRTRSFT